MPAKNDNLVLDGILSALSGVDSGRSPSLIQQDQLAYAVNCSMRGGYIETRPAFIKQDLDFEDSETEWWFDNKFHGGRGNYTDPIGQAHVVIIIGGRVFIINTNNNFAVHEITPTTTTNVAAAYVAPALQEVNTLTVVDAGQIWEDYPLWINGYKFLCLSKDLSTNEVTVKNITCPPGTAFDDEPVQACDPNSSRYNQHWVLQADTWLIIQNNRNAAILYDGSSSRRSNGYDMGEMPCGSAMAYIHGRIWVATNMREIVAGDILGGGTEIVEFTEAHFYAEGGNFRVDTDITGIGTMANLDVAMGQGPIMVFTRERVYSINVPTNRVLWKEVQYPIQTVTANIGATSHNSIVNVNSDMFYRAIDGWRSLMLARRESANWGNVPVSSEMDRVLDDEDQQLLAWTEGVVFDNWFIGTVSPMRQESAVYSRGLVALDYSVISRMGSKSPPAWEGTWTHPEILVSGIVKLVSDGRDRAFMLAVDAKCHNSLWEIKPSEWDDTDTEGTRIPIESWLESRSLLFDGPLALDRLMDLQIWVDSVIDTVTLTAQWRPDQSPCWFDWGSKSICATVTQCGESATCQTLTEYRPGYASRIGFGTPPDSEEPLDFKPARDGYEHQLKLKWEGHLRVRKILVKAQPVVEGPWAIC